MPNIFPSLTAPLVAPTTSPTGNRPVHWGGAPSFNFDLKEFDIKNGQIIMLNDVGAFIQWLRKSLITARFKFKIYWFRGHAGFGSDFPPLIGKPYNDTVKESVAVRFCREAIQFDSRIKSIPSITAVLQADYITVTISLIVMNGMELQFSQLWTVR
jgi:Protein of unknown function (DUF2634)